MCSQKVLEANKVGFARLDGTMSFSNRSRALKDFSENADVCAFLVSLRSGGVGLNLTAASHVILIDPWWNPSGELKFALRSSFSLLLVPIFAPCSAAGKMLLISFCVVCVLFLLSSAFSLPGPGCS